jgi:hypothetical protein
MIPVQDQLPQVQADVAQPAAASAAYLAGGASLLTPESTWLAASGVAAMPDLSAPDALRVLGASPGSSASDRARRRFAITDNSCRP